MFFKFFLRAGTSSRTASARTANSQTLLKIPTISCSAVLLTLLLAPRAWPVQAPDYSIHQEYTSTRAMGMGNAFVAVVDDHSSLFYNPAALALRKDTQLRFFVRAGLDPNFLDFTDEVDAAGDDEAKLNAAMEKQYGEHLYFRVPTVGAIIARPKWSMAIIPADVSTDLSFQRSVISSVFVNSYIDTTIAYGRATTWKVPKLKNRLAFGWSAKLLHRAYYSDIIQAAQLANDEDIVNIDRAAEGVTLDADIGFLYSVKRSKGKWFQPTFGLAVRNLFDYGFPTNFAVFNDDPKEPPKLERRIDVGTKFALPNFWVFEPKFALDIRDIGHSNWTWLKGFHTGAEMYWKMRNWWKGHWSVGVNQGYWSAGFGARLAIFQIDLASWGEEVGTVDTKRESRRYMLEMSLDF